jgi:uncharacterized protein
MPASKEEIARKYGLTPDEFDVMTALALRPTCENCNVVLPPDSTDARICSFECTFCATCVETRLHNVCPNCGGGFAPRPIRPRTNWRRGNYLGAHPARTLITHKPVDATAHAEFAREIANLPPYRR